MFYESNAMALDLSLVREEGKKNFVLDDGTVIRRGYSDPVLEEKRVAALNWLGVRWLSHPKNSVVRVDSLVDNPSYFLTRFFDKQKLNASI